MTRDECKKLLMVIDASYPNFKADDLTATLNAWYFILAEYEYRHAAKGLKDFIAWSGSSFPPSVSQIAEAARKAREHEGPDTERIWGMVKEAASASLNDAENAFRGLPEIAREIIGYPAKLHEWGMMITRNEDSIKASFRRNYEALWWINLAGGRSKNPEPPKRLGESKMIGVRY